MTLSANAQFHATPNGIATDDGKEAYSVHIDASSIEAYNKVRTIIIQKYGASSVMYEEKEQKLTFRTHTPTAFKLKGDMAVTIYASVVMDLSLNFQDGCIEILPPVINENIPVGLHGSYPKVAKGNMGFWYLYKNNGKPYYKNAISRFDEWLNIFISEFVSSISNK